MEIRLLKTLLVFLFLCVFVLNARYCRPKKRFYKNGKCKKCQRCENGQMNNITVSVRLHATFGALNCQPCISCPPGTFSDDSTYARGKNTKSCKSWIDCPGMGREYAVEPNASFIGKCSATCPPCHYPFAILLTDSPCMECSEDTLHRKECAMWPCEAENASLLTSTLVTTTNSETNEKTIGNALDTSTPPSGTTSKSVVISLVVVIVLLAVVLGLIVAIFWFLARCFQTNRDKYPIESPTTTALSSYSSVQKPETQPFMSPVPELAVVEDLLETDCPSEEMDMPIYRDLYYEKLTCASSYFGKIEHMKIPESSNHLNLLAKKAVVCYATLFNVLLPDQNKAHILLGHDLTTPDGRYECLERWRQVTVPSNKDLLQAISRTHSLCEQEQQSVYKQIFYEIYRQMQQQTENESSL